MMSSKDKRTGRMALKNWDRYRSMKPRSTRASKRLCTLGGSSSTLLLRNSLNLLSRHREKGQSHGAGQLRRHESLTARLPRQKVKAV